MLVPDKVHVPVPFLVKPPVVVPIMLARLLPVAVPSNVKVKVGPVMVPALLITMLPLLALIVLALPKVIKPL